MEDPLTLIDPDAALYPLLDAVKDSLNSVPTLRALVIKILSHPEIFCGYDQLRILLCTEGKTMDDSALLATLDLFSYGTYATYAQTPSSYLPLNDKQIAKLRQLTLLSCVHNACELGQSSLSYTSIGEALQITDQRAMEQIILSCFYSRVLNGRLCQKTRQLWITQVPVCISRDVPRDTISKLLQKFQALQDRLDTSHTGLEEAHSDVSQSVAQSIAYWKSVQHRQAKLQASNSSASAAIADSSGSGDPDSPSPLLGGWPEGGMGVRRFSAARQSNKRSRGGLGGPITDPFQRF